MPVLFHGLNFTTGLDAVVKFAAFGLEVAFLDVGGQGLAFLVSPTFFGVLRFKGAA
ncbi:MAG TPA: hypothetical protein VKG25_07405 [Bryobacteraceae bacterium]|nr:hypothetical protein [Bryobacteraceae bacterium]